MVGGRVATASNKRYHFKRKITYSDACSLYPSAMYEMDELLEGKPQVLRNTSYEFLKQQGGYFIRIELIKLNKHLYFPLTNKINEETGVRGFINEMDNGYIYIYILIKQDEKI